MCLPLRAHEDVDTVKRQAGNGAFYFLQRWEAEAGGSCDSSHYWITIVEETFFMTWQVIDELA